VSLTPDPPERLRVLFAGTPEVAVASLHALIGADDLEVVAVLTNPDRPRGRRGAAVAPPVAVAASAQGIPVLQPERPDEFLEVVASLRVDVGAVVAYGSILSRPVLEVPRFGFVNLHFSLLPRWRGAAPVQHAIRAGDEVTGVSVFRLEEGLDTGPVLRRLAVPVAAGEDAGALLDRLARLGADVLLDGVRAAAAGEPGEPQASEGITSAPKLGPEDARVAWDRPAVVVERMIRSVTPRPGARTRAHGESLKVARPEVVAIEGAGVPGTVLALDEGLVVQCGQGAVAVHEVQLEGRRWVSAIEFARGNKVRVGDRLGEQAAKV
jgi:methionyl-tRNA formyltransferase